MSTTYDITASQGVDIQLTFTALNSSGTAMDLTNYTVSGYVKSKYSDTGILLDLHPTISSGISGLISVSVPHSGFDTIPTQQAFYDVDIYPQSGNIVQAVKGSFNIGPSVTY